MLPLPVATASNPSPLAPAARGGAGLVAYDFADARASVQRVLQFLDRMKIAVDDRESD
jgi:hypothetical protein